MTRRPLTLMLIDEDPVFRLGLRIWLEQFQDFTVVAEADGGATALSRLAEALDAAAIPESEAETESEGETEASRGLDLVILDLGLGASDPEQTPGLQLCQQIKQRYPQLPLLALSAQLEPVLQAAAQQMGADGVGLRGQPVRDLAQQIRQLAQGVAVTDPTAPPEPLPPPLSRWQTLRLNLRDSGLSQIEAALAELPTPEGAVADSPAEALTQAVVAGRRRELKAARWLLQQLLTPTVDGTTPPVVPPRPPRPPRGGAIQPRPRSTPVRLTQAEAGALQFTVADLQGAVFDGVFRLLQTDLDNRSEVPLEIDILRPEKKRELLFLTLRQFEDLLEDLRHSQITPGQLPEKSALVLQDLWQAVTTDFLGKYYTVQIGGVEQAVVPALLEEQETVQREILAKIPLGQDLLNHLLFQDSLMVEGASYAAVTPEAIAHSQKLLAHLLIQVANGVMQPLLNQFADVEPLKKHLYHRRLISSRDIERFRNELAWRYRWDAYVQEPTAIFESQYRLFTLGPTGIGVTMIYSPRRQELDQLSGTRYAVTLALEARDAIAPRLRATIGLLGNGVVYVLTEVVGRGIGLVGRGIIKGVGQAWQDTRFRRPNGNKRESENS